MKLVVLGLSLFGFVALAGELDDVVTRPAGVFVKVDPINKHVDVYRAGAIDPAIRSGAVTSYSAEEKERVAADEENRLARPENLIASLKSDVAELDKDGSRPACWYGGWGAGWGWSGWGGYTTSYSSYWSNPWYSPGYFGYGGYNYNYGYGWGGGYRSYGWYW